MKPFSLISRSVLALAALPLLFPLGAEAQRMGPQGPLALPDPVAQALEHRDALGLSADQLAALERFSAESAGRTAEARARVEAWRSEVEARAEAWRSEMEARREALRELPREERTREARTRGEQRPEPMTPDPELREAMRLLQEERQAARNLLASTLTVEQMRGLQTELQAARRAELRGDLRGERRGERLDRAPARFHGNLQGTAAYRAGFMAGFRSAQRPAFQRPALQRPALQRRSFQDLRMPRFQRR